MKLSNHWQRKVWLFQHLAHQEIPTLFVSAAANTAELLSPLLIDSTSLLGTELQSPVRAVPGYLEQCPLVAAVITVYASVMTVMCLLGNYPHGWANSNKHRRHWRQYSHISTRRHTTRWAGGRVTISNNQLLFVTMSWFRDTLRDIVTPHISIHDTSDTW